MIEAVAILEDLGNPFEEDNGELYNIHSKDALMTITVESISDVIKIGKDQHRLAQQISGGTICPANKVNYRYNQE